MAARFPSTGSPAQEDEEFSLEALIQRIDDICAAHSPLGQTTPSPSDNKCFTPTTEFKESPAQRLFIPSPNKQPPSSSPSPVASPGRPLANSGCQYESPTIAFQPSFGLFGDPTYMGLPNPVDGAFANPNYQSPTPSAQERPANRCVKFDLPPGPDAFVNPGYQHQTPGSSDAFANPAYQHQTPDTCDAANTMFQNMYSADSPNMVDTSGEQPFTPGVGEVYQLDPNWYQKYDTSSQPEPRRNSRWETTYQAYFKNPYEGERNPNQQAAPVPQMFPPRIRSPSEELQDMSTRERSLSCHVAHYRGLPVPGDRAVQHQPHNVPVTFNPNIRQDVAAARLECMENLPMPRDTSQAQERFAIEQIWEINRKKFHLK